MVKIDLVTGFLGSGKTTFIKKYAKYLLDNNYNLCILENDFGAVNVDMMLLDDLTCGKEMVSGACDYDCHLRRFKTKLIQMALMGYDRVIVEPSGIYDTDEFFDALSEDPLNKLYEISNIFFIYDINTNNLSYESKYILTSEAANAGKIIVTKNESNNKVDLSVLNNILKEFKCSRIFSESDLVNNADINFSELINSGYHNYSYIKIPINKETNYDSIYFLNEKIDLEKIKALSYILFNDAKYGLIMRIKGFIFENNKWYKINITKNEKEIGLINDGQNVLIIIGEKLDKDLITNLIK
ncbi:MAG: GTPase (G3E family) [bacterium]|nr:GTPase (G3E family) [bacterium]